MVNRDALAAGLQLDGLSSEEQAMIVLVYVERALNGIAAEGRDPDAFEVQYLGYALAALPRYGAQAALHYAWHALDPERLPMLSSVPLDDVPAAAELRRRLGELKTQFGRPNG